MSTARERVQQEAEERASIESIPVTFAALPEWAGKSAYRAGFIAGRTVTAEQIEQAAIYLANVDGLELPCVPAEDEAWIHYPYRARETFRAAGFIVEE